MKITINKKKYSIDPDDAEMPLLWFIRDHAGLTGTKYGCGIGACGACVVLIEGDAKPSCLLRIKDVAARQITTIEGLAENSNHPVLQAWERLQVPQCGYCQSGQILTAVSLLGKIEKPDESSIKKAMSGVICRCGTYPRILQAVKYASEIPGK